MLAVPFDVLYLDKSEGLPRYYSATVFGDDMESASLVVDKPTGAVELTISWEDATKLRLKMPPDSSTEL